MSDVQKDSVQHVYLVREAHVYHYFEDWVNPFLNSVRAVVPVQIISFEEANTTKFNNRDVILVLQKTHGLHKKNVGEYWFMNTEGLDKDFAENAIETGFTNIIDFTLKGVQRLSKLGAERALWLPILQPPGLPVYLPRTHVCMVGPANTRRRKKFVNDLQQHSTTREEEINFKHIEGWAAARDFESQTCSLAVHLSSTDVNQLVARLRLDLLWFYNIPILSESAFEPDVSEYLGTVSFVSLPQLAEETLAIWLSLRAGNSTTILSRITRSDWKSCEEGILFQRSH